MAGNGARVRAGGAPGGNGGLFPVGGEPLLLAAYQAATSLLVYRGLTPPAGLEGWSHVLTPTLLNDETGTLIPSRDRRNDLATRLRDLYDLRIDADYIASREVRPGQVIVSRRDAGFILRPVGDVLPER